VNQVALQELGRQPLDWRAKGWPALPPGTTVEQFVADRPSLFTAGFLPPVMTLRDSAVDANVATMADFCATRGMLLAPHGKTHMAPQLAARQLAGGSWGITVATISQARVYRSFGVRRLLLANELVDPAGVAWAMGELAADPDFEFFCYVDSTAGVDLIAAALDGAPGARPLDVLVEVGPTGARTGCRTVAQAVTVAKAASAVPRLRVCGVAGYEGGIGQSGLPDAETLAAVRDFMGLIRDAGQAVVHADLLGRDDLIASAGGSTYFDVVADELGSGWTVDRDVTPVLRSGSYLTHDSLLYAERSPFAERIDGELIAALAVWGTVLSVPEPGLALVAGGRRDFPFDSGMPVPQVVRRAADGTTRPATGLTVTALNDQHAYLRLADDVDDVRVGDWIRFGISHPCTAFDKWSHIAVVDDEDRVVDCVRTFF
jgi:D-serine deaminase-like pyridoxal phosphate-dependent protein